MIIERAEIFIRDGMMEEAVAVLREKALPLTSTYVDCRRFTALRGVENAHSILFWVEWDSIAAHEQSRLAPEHAA